MVSWQTLAFAVIGAVANVSGALLAYLQRPYNDHAARLARAFFGLSLTALIPMLGYFLLVTADSPAQALLGARVTVAIAPWFALRLDVFGRSVAGLPPHRHPWLMVLIAVAISAVCILSSLVVTDLAAPGAPGALSMGGHSVLRGPLSPPLSLVVFASFAGNVYRGLRPSAPREARGLGLALMAWTVASLYHAGLAFGLYRGPYAPGFGFLILFVTITHTVLRSVRDRERERHELSLALVQKTREAEAAQAALVNAERLSSLGQVAAGVAHEVNNPAGFILANLSQLRGQFGSNPATARAFDDSIEGVRRIRVIVSALQSLARGDQGELEPLRLDRVAETALLLAGPSVKQRIEFARDLRATPQVMGRAGQIIQAVLDLITDASESAAPTATVRVTIATRCEGESVLLEVSDDIPTDAQRTPPEGAVMRRGTVQMTVAAFGGSMDIRRTEQGTSRVIRLPVAAVQTQSPEPTPTDQRLPPRGTPPPARGRILIIDDEPALVRILSRVLSRSYDTLTARNGDEARVLVRSHGDRISLVLCDVLMADVNGVDLRDELARTAPRLASRFTFMTGGSLPDDLMERIRASKCPVLQKPIEPDELVVHIATRIGGADAAQ